MTGVEIIATAALTAALADSAGGVLNCFRNSSQVAVENQTGTTLDLSTYDGTDKVCWVSYADYKIPNGHTAMVTSRSDTTQIYDNGKKQYLPKMPNGKGLIVYSNGSTKVVG